MPQDTRALRGQLEVAMERQRYKDAVLCLEQLEELEPAQPRWPHRRGDVLRRLGDKRKAVEAYESATDLYGQQGFIARAVAMAKTILLLDASRTDILERVDQTEGRRVHREHHRSIAGPISVSSPPARAVKRAPPPPPPPSVPSTPAGLPVAGPRPMTPVPLARVGLVPAVMAPVGMAPSAIEPAEEAPVLLTQKKRPPPPPAATPVAPLPIVEDVDDDDVDGVELDLDSLIRVPAARLSEMPPEAGLAEQSVKLEIDIDFSEAELTTSTEAEVASQEAEAPDAGRLALLPVFSLFAEAPKAVLFELSRGSELVELEDGEPVVRLGAPADALYAIVEGSVQVRVPGVPASGALFLTEGDVFGESCLLEAEPRRADVIAHGHLVALKIPATLLAKVVETHPPMGEVLFELLTRRLIGNLMRASPLFNVFDPPTRVELAKLFEIRRVEREVVLIEAGKKSDALYIALTGRLRAEARSGSPTIAGPGAMWGQEALIAQQASPLTITTAVKMVVLRLPASSFISVASQYPLALEFLAEMTTPVSGERLS